MNNLNCYDFNISAAGFEASDFEWFLPTLICISQPTADGLQEKCFTNSLKSRVFKFNFMIFPLQVQVYLLFNKSLKLCFNWSLGLVKQDLKGKYWYVVQ